jgi:hypothetical protein
VFPEAVDLAAQLAASLDLVSKANLNLAKGDALDLLPIYIAASSGPLCIFHSACVVYWSDHAKAALDDLLLMASREREFFRVGMEPPLVPRDDFYLEILASHYRHGSVETLALASIPSPRLDEIVWRN